MAVEATSDEEGWANLAKVGALISSDPTAASRLSLWGRRLVGEAITQAQYVLAEHDELVDLVMAGGEGLTQIAGFFDRLQQTHQSRMQELGLA